MLIGRENIFIAPNDVHIYAGPWALPNPTLLIPRASRAIKRRCALSLHRALAERKKGTQTELRAIARAR